MFKKFRSIFLTIIITWIILFLSYILIKSYIPSFVSSVISFVIPTFQDNHNKINEGYQWTTQQENHTTSWNETTIKTINETSWDEINETKNENINQDVNQKSKTDDNILWKEEFEKLKKETKYFPEEMDYDTYVANIQYWNEKTNQAQLKILEERKTNQTK